MLKPFQDLGLNMISTGEHYSNANILKYGCIFLHLFYCGMQAKPECFHSSVSQGLCKCVHKLNIKHKPMEIDLKSQQ